MRPSRLPSLTPPPSLPPPPPLPPRLPLSCQLSSSQPYLSPVPSFCPSHPQAVIEREEDSLERIFAARRRVKPPVWGSSLSYFAYLDVLERAQQAYLDSFARVPSLPLPSSLLLSPLLSSSVPSVLPSLSYFSLYPLLPDPQNYLKCQYSQLTDSLSLLACSCGANPSQACQRTLRDTSSSPIAVHTYAPSPHPAHHSSPAPLFSLSRPLLSLSPFSLSPRSPL